MSISIFLSATSHSAQFIDKVSNSNVNTGISHWPNTCLQITSKLENIHLLNILLDISFVLCSLKCQIQYKNKCVYLVLIAWIWFIWCLKLYISFSGCVTIAHYIYIYIYITLNAWSNFKQTWYTCHCNELIIVPGTICLALTVAINIFYSFCMPHRDLFTKTVPL